MDVLEFQARQKFLCGPTGDHERGVSSYRGDITEELIERADLSGFYSLSDTIRGTGS